MQGRQNIQSQKNANQPPRHTILSGRVSPQNFKRVGPAISEMLRTSVRAKRQNEVPNDVIQSNFRPNSGAGAFLYLEEKEETDYVDNVRKPELRSQKQELVDVQRSSAPTTRIALPIGRNSNKRQPPTTTAEPTEKRVLMTQRTLRRPKSRQGTRDDTVTRRRDSMRSRIPAIMQHQPSNTRVRRVSKALPALPPPSPLPGKTGFNQNRQDVIDAFQNHKDKVLRGHGSPATVTTAAAPPMKYTPGSSDNTSGSSYDSAEQTWNMINSMMSAINEEDIKRARQSLVHENVQNKRVNPRNTGYVTFPRISHSRRDANELQNGYDTSGESDSPASRPSRQRTEQPGKQDANRFSSTFPRVRGENVSLNRRASAASVFSIVIQPTRELSLETQEPLISEGDIPSRIKGILQCTHKKSLSTLSSSRTSSVYSDEAELHPDVMQTIDALRSVEDIERDDIKFDS